MRFDAQISSYLENLGNLGDFSFFRGHFVCCVCLGGPLGFLGGAGLALGFLGGPPEDHWRSFGFPGGSQGAPKNGGGYLGASRDRPGRPLGWF